MCDIVVSSMYIVQFLCMMYVCVCLRVQDTMDRDYIGMNYQKIALTLDNISHAFIKEVTKSILTVKFIDGNDISKLIELHSSLSHVCEQNCEKVTQNV